MAHHAPNDSSLADLASNASRALDADAKRPESHPRPEPGRTRQVVAIVAILVSLAIAAFEVRTLAPAAPDRTEIARGLGVSLGMAHRDVFAYWDSTGRLPESLEQVGPRQPSLSYSAQGTYFRLAFLSPRGDSVALGFSRRGRGGFRVP